MTTVLGVVGSPNAGGRTTTVVRSLLDGAQRAGAQTSLLELATATTADVIAAIEAADAVVFGSPVYRASHTALLMSLLESVQRGKYGEPTAPLRGKATAVVFTGSTAHHYLSLDNLRSVLAGFFAAQVLSPGLYVDNDSFTPDKALTDEVAALAARHGAALVDLSVAVQASTALSTLEPQV